ncbi:MAG TPA: hypothetical protein VGW75_16080 [Solirubrobacteraceae bacterium]|nr:hypothetical protein [Solirubrobacteraceae bacterium]
MDERAEVRDALKVIVAPNQPDWSPAGVYCYWDRESHEILYLGLTGDLPGRFAQHNGLVKHPESGNKWKYIEPHLETRGRIGFSVVLQGKAISLMEQLSDIDATLGWQRKQVLAVGEGQLIESHRLAYGASPPWNTDPGSRLGRQWATKADALLDLLAARRESLFAARVPIRRLATDLGARFKEGVIHASRMRAVMALHEVAEMPSDQDDEETIRRKIMKSLMLRNGHLVDDLDASDDQIRHWMATLGDPAYWSNEPSSRRAQLEEAVASRPGEAQARDVMAFLDSIVSDVPPPGHVEATRDMLSGDYLCQPIQIP